MNESRRIDLAFPLRIDGTGQVATSSYTRHVYEMIEQVLFTLPGERVNRPEFGSKVPFYVFQPIRADLMDDAKTVVQLALQRWMGDVIKLESVRLVPKDSTVSIHIKYTILSINQTFADTFQV
jgi:phage baseplate assembly protein W